MCSLGPWPNMNRISKSTDTSSRRRWLHRRLCARCALSLLLIAVACTPVRPVAKVGLVAPFEGLYRRTGYAALGAVRRAVEDCSPDHTAVLPLALDDSAQPHKSRRAAQELLADPTVAAVIGPFTLDTVAAVEATLSQGAPAWVVPIAIDASGQFAAPGHGRTWLADFILRVWDLAQAQGADSLVVAGLPRAWEEPVMQQVSLAKSHDEIAFANSTAIDFGSFAPNSAFLWLGQTHLGVPLAAAMHEAQPDAAFWTGPSVENALFTERNTATGPLFWATWATPQYNSASQLSAPDELLEALTYASTCHALAQVYGTSGTEPQPLSLHAFTIDGNGEFESSANP